jgi:hypothetical protein
MYVFFPQYFYRAITFLLSLQNYMTYTVCKGENEKNYKPSRFQLECLHHLLRYNNNNNKIYYINCYSFYSPCTLCVLQLPLIIERLAQSYTYKELLVHTTFHL